MENGHYNMHPCAYIDIDTENYPILTLVVMVMEILALDQPLTTMLRILALDQGCNGSANVTNDVLQFFLKLTLVAMVTKIWDSTSNNEIIVLYGLWQNNWTDTVLEHCLSTLDHDYLISAVLLRPPGTLCQEQLLTTTH